MATEIQCMIPSRVNPVPKAVELSQPRGVYGSTAKYHVFPWQKSVIFRGHITIM